jgi:hypothetical protein
MLLVGAQVPFATNFTVLRPNVTGLVPDAFGEVVAKVSSSLVLELRFTQAAKPGIYAAGSVSAITNKFGWLAQLVKGSPSSTSAGPSRASIVPESPASSDRKNLSSTLLKTKMDSTKMTFKKTSSKRIMIVTSQQRLLRATGAS